MNDSNRLDSLFDQLGTHRKANIAVFAQLAELAGEGCGFTPRDPDAPDVTLGIMREAFNRDSKRAAALLAEVVANDRIVDEIAMRIVREVVG